MASLPADLLLLICEQIASQQDFNTLFNCTLTGKQLAGSALLWLYRIHNQCNFITNNEVADWSKTEAQLNWHERIDRETERVTYWALLWKSIIRSSLETTAYPYCLYIQSLDLRNLEYLLDDPVFRGKVSSSFFADEMSKFSIGNETPIKLKTRLGKDKKQAYTYLNVARILEQVGESITSFVSESARLNDTSAALEDVAGNISATALPVWTARLSRLKSLTLYDGAALSEGVALAIADKCYNFNDLTFRDCTGDDADKKLASFFHSLRGGSLESFEAINAFSIGPETLLSLNHHAASLRVLKLQGLRFNVISSVPLLQGCHNLEILELHGSIPSEGLINLETTQNDVFLEITAAFRLLKRLCELSFKNFPGATEILKEILVLENIQLRKLFVSGYSFPGHRLFHRAITHQVTLESLELCAEAEHAYRGDINILIDSLCQLTNLTYLNLRDTSDHCTTKDIKKLASKLLKLEEFAFGGYDVTDDIWREISGLHYLKTLEVQALTYFTFDGILNYISALRETNKGLSLTVGYQVLEHDLTEQEKAIIKEAIAAKVDGRFEFQLYRDEEDEYDSTSD